MHTGVFYKMKSRQYHSEVFCRRYRAVLADECLFITVTAVVIPVPHAVSAAHLSDYVDDSVSCEDLLCCRTINFFTC